ncbi:hypothetical protein BDP81DRAFT_220839 [Colletotrichum phormii]|uniref:Uncharacterized protein n=1 Tax=Colletotrichum phormii TaxID=359342 RepID=A0AAI9ZUJ9_9PEZI|nr:uncharacterized protein BDP81DRAFT_220839 [Colletotrichum phormii]KAK1637233.1 hypothetical protein BDP81DRAFT_220839 [Colletotrichum phormii]
MDDVGCFLLPFWSQTYRAAVTFDSDLCVLATTTTDPSRAMYAPYSVHAVRSGGSLVNLPASTFVVPALRSALIQCGWGGLLCCFVCLIETTSFLERSRPLRVGRNKGAKNLGLPMFPGIEKAGMLRMAERNAHDMAEITTGVSHLKSGDSEGHDRPLPPSCQCVFASSGRCFYPVVRDNGSRSSSIERPVAGSWSAQFCHDCHGRTDGRIRPCKHFRMFGVGLGATPAWLRMEDWFMPCLAQDGLSSGIFCLSV